MFPTRGAVRVRPCTFTSVLNIYAVAFASPPAREGGYRACPETCTDLLIEKYFWACGLHFEQHRCYRQSLVALFHLVT